MERLDRPAGGGPLIFRERLLSLLDQSGQVPLTLMLAPPGSGKTTLLLHWLQQQGSRRKIYYAVPRRDNDPQRFFRGLLERLHGLLDAQPSMRRALRLPAPALGAWLAARLERCAEPLCLILDDFQHLTDPETLAGVAALLERLPARVCLLIAGHARPELPLGRWRLDDRLLAIDAVDLGFSAEELRDLYACLGGGHLDEHEQAGLLEATEGWATGVSMALRLRAQGDAAMVRFDGSQPGLAEFFHHEVLGDLPEDCWQLLITSAVFERFDGAACDAVLGYSGAARQLERLALRQLFLMPLAEAGWYRHHTLLRGFLANRLAIEQPERIAELHGRAARHFLARGEYVQAVRHAGECADPTLRLAVLGDCCQAWLRNGEFATVVHWLGRLPEEQLEAQPHLRLCLIEALTLSRRFHLAAHHLALAARGGAEPDALRCLDFYLQLFQQDCHFLPEAGWEALGEARQPLALRARALVIGGYHHLLHGRLAQALRQAMQGKELLAEAGLAFLESYADLVIALCHRQAGRVAQVRREVSLDFQRTDPGEPAWVNRATAMVVALYEQNRLEAAEPLCEQLLIRVGGSSATEAIATVYLTLSRLLFRRRVHERAGRLLEQLAGMLQLGRYGRFSSQLVQEQVRQAWLAGRSALLESLVRRYRLDAALAEGIWDRARDHDEAWERQGLAVVYWLQTRGQHGRAERVLRVLLESLRRTELQARRLVVEACLLTLLARQQDEAEQRRGLVRLVEEYGLVTINRSVFDEAPGFGEGPFGLLDSTGLDVPERYRELFGEFLLPAPSTQRPWLAGLLTGKEVEIFDCLLRGLSNTEISERTGIALSTTKWHLKNIYAKLNVANRTEAILCARPRSVS